MAEVPSWVGQNGNPKLKVCRLNISNFRGIKTATVLLPRHAVLIGDNNAGKTTLLEALDLVLGPDRLNRQPPIDEHDFFQGNYLAKGAEAAGVAVEGVGPDAEVGTAQAAAAAADDGVTDLVEAITGEALVLRLR